jgi:4-carboxymuconolactone decarboxylase
MTSGQRKIYDAIVKDPRGAQSGSLHVAIHCSELAEKCQQLDEFLRYRTSLPPHLSELAVLVTARHCNCEIEWHIHEQLALEAGLSRDVVEAIRDRSAPSTEDNDIQKVHAFAAELNEYNTVGEMTYWRVLDRFGAVGVVDLTALIGYHTMLAMTLNTHEIALPEGVEPRLN